VLGVDGDEELDGLPGVEPVEEHSGDFDAQVLASLGQGMESEEPVLTVQHAQHPMLFRDLEQAQIVLARHGGEGEALLRRDDHRTGDGGQGARILAVLVVPDELVDLAANDRPLIRSLAFADALLEGLPVHPRTVAPLGFGWGGRRARIAQDLELDQAVYILGREGSLEEFHTELLHAVRGDGDHDPPPPFPGAACRTVG
jgi:hypothetical protein